MLSLGDHKTGIILGLLLSIFCDLIGRLLSLGNQGAGSRTFTLRFPDNPVGRLLSLGNQGAGSRIFTLRFPDNPGGGLLSLGDHKTGIILGLLLSIFCDLIGRLLSLSRSFRKALLCGLVRLLKNLTGSQLSFSNKAAGSRTFSLCSLDNPVGGLLCLRDNAPSVFFSPVLLVCDDPAHGLFSF